MRSIILQQDSLGHTPRRQMYDMDMQERVQIERQRQLWLRALGLPCWVAQDRLPAAAETPLLKDAAPATPAPASRVPAGIKQPGTRPPADRQSSPNKRTASGTGQVKGDSVGAFTLQAFNTSRHWLIVQQSVAQTAHFSPEEGQVLDKLLRLWTVVRGDIRSLRFTPSVLDPAELLTGFLQALAEQKPRFLFLIEEPLNELLIKGPRYQPGEWGGASILVVSSLREMLAAPAEHKRRSWDAMKQAGYA